MHVVLPANFSEGTLFPGKIKECHSKTKDKRAGNTVDQCLANFKVRLDMVLVFNDSDIF